jgi:hypothetical protein
MNIKDKIGYFLLTGVCPLVLLIHISIWTCWAYVMPTTLHNVLLFTVALITFSILAICFVFMFKKAETIRQERVQERVQGVERMGITNTVIEQMAETIRQERAQAQEVEEVERNLIIGQMIESALSRETNRAIATDLNIRQERAREPERANTIDLNIRQIMESVPESYGSYLLNELRTSTITSGRPIIVSTQKNRGAQEPTPTKVSATEPTPKKITNAIFELEISD